MGREEYIGYRLPLNGQKAHHQHGVIMNEEKAFIEEFNKRHTEYCRAERRFKKVSTIYEHLKEDLGFFPENHERPIGVTIQPACSAGSFDIGIPTGRIAHLIEREFDEAVEAVKKTRADLMALAREAPDTE